MHGCLLRVNNLPVTSVRLRTTEDGKGFDIYIDDPDFGPFPLSRSCLLEYLDLSVPKVEREKDPFRGWRRVTYDELVQIIQRIRAGSAA